MFDFLKDNRVLALALAGTPVFLLCLVIWLAGMLGGNGSAPAPVAATIQSGSTALNSPADNTTAGQTDHSPGTAGRTVNGKQLPSWAPACAPQCPGPWIKDFDEDDAKETAPSMGSVRP